MCELGRTSPAGARLRLRCVTRARAQAAPRTRPRWRGCAPRWPPTSARTRSTTSRAAACTGRPAPGRRRAGTSARTTRGRARRRAPRGPPAWARPARAPVRRTRAHSPDLAAAPPWSHRIPSRLERPCVALRMAATSCAQHCWTADPGSHRLHEDESPAMRTSCGQCCALTPQPGLWQRLPWRRMTRRRMTRKSQSPQTRQARRPRSSPPAAQAARLARGGSAARRTSRSTWVSGGDVCGAGARVRLYSLRWGCVRGEAWCARSTWACVAQRRARADHVPDRPKRR